MQPRPSVPVDAASRTTEQPSDTGSIASACRPSAASRCCDAAPNAAAGALIEQVKSERLYPVRGLAFERRDCGFYVAGFDPRADAHQIEVSRMLGFSDEPTWTRTFETEGRGSAYDLTLAPNGDLLVVGGTAWLGDRRTERAWIHRLSADGEDAWPQPQTLGPGEYTDARSVAVREDGVIAMIGSFSGPTPQTTYVALFAADGTALWSQPYVNSDTLVAGKAIVFAPDGSLVLGGTATAAAGLGLAIERIDDQGKPIALPTGAFAGPGPTFSPSIALDGEGNLVVATCYLPDQWRQLWLQKFDLDGQPLWPQPVSPEWPGHVIVQDLAVSETGEIAIIGTTQIPLPGMRDIWVTLYSRDGEPRWRQPFIFDGRGDPFNPNDNSDDLGWSIDFDQLGNVLVAGWYDGNRAFVARIAH
jgi:hypothetical protein